MKKILFAFQLVLSSIAFGQYIENATLKFEKLDETVSAKDVVYVNDKLIQFRNTNYPYVLSYAKLKKLEKFEFDSTQFHQNAPKLNETFSEKREGRGVYLTIDDLINGNLTEMPFRSKSIGLGLYEYTNDLIDVVDYETKKIKDIAGVLLNGYVYVSVKHASDHESKDEKGSFVLKHGVHTFVRVKYMGDDFLYFEMPLQTMGNLIATTAVGVGIGGAIGGALAGVVSTNSPADYRPIIMYFSKKEFHTIKNCKNFNEHFERQNSTIRINCDNDDYNLNNIRRTIITEL
ncbi:hypothetical protein [Moheibacter lacus]|uniref:GLPGLI family protein n=1 Tax=Moheibacter lacus TaxID=2745851 RepID=A0A838ZSB5_9FLAO|nr:hypothetical protein [Moheibacter lacus]MBA5629309.1 hypothetical protein [Moheibacter lacus]